MRSRHPEALPRLWLMTDERLGDRLWHALAALPRGSGVIFRHYSLSPPARRALFAKVATIARRRGLVLLRAGNQPLGRQEDGAHNARTRHRGINSRSAHSGAQVQTAIRNKADFVLISPVFPTESHPGAPVLGPVRAAALASQSRIPAIALGGMTRENAKRLRSADFYGWAAIGWWADQKRKAVPT